METTLDTGKFDRYFRLYTTDYRKRTPKNKRALGGQFDKLFQENEQKFRRDLEEMRPIDANKLLDEQIAMLEEKLKPPKKRQKRGSLPDLEQEPPDPDEPRTLTPHPTTPAEPPPRRGKGKYQYPVSSPNSTIGLGSRYSLHRLIASNRGRASPAVSETASALQGRVDKAFDYTYEGTPAVGEGPGPFQLRESFKEKRPPVKPSPQGTGFAYGITGVATGREYDPDLSGFGRPGVSLGDLKHFHSTHPNIEDPSIVLTRSEKKRLTPETPAHDEILRALRTQDEPLKDLRQHIKATKQLGTKIIPTFATETTPVPMSPTATARTFLQEPETFKPEEKTQGPLTGDAAESFTLAGGTPLYTGISPTPSEQETKLLTPADTQESLEETEKFPSYISRVATPPRVSKLTREDRQGSPFRFIREGKSRSLTPVPSKPASPVESLASTTVFPDRPRSPTPDLLEDTAFTEPDSPLFAGTAASEFREATLQSPRPSQVYSLPVTGYALERIRGGRSPEERVKERVTHKITDIHSRAPGKSDYYASAVAHADQPTTATQRPAGGDSDPYGGRKQQDDEERRREEERRRREQDQKRREAHDAAQRKRDRDADDTEEESEEEDAGSEPQLPERERKFTRQPQRGALQGLLQQPPVPQQVKIIQQHPAIIPVVPSYTRSREQEKPGIQIKISTKSQAIINEKKKGKTNKRKAYNKLRKQTIKAIKVGKNAHYKIESAKLTKLPTKERVVARAKLKKVLRDRELRLIGQLPSSSKMAIKDLDRVMRIAKKLRW